jgi:hypothetical protein
MDWIRARRKCSIEHAWNTLCERIRTDIDTWREADDLAATVEFSMDANVAIVTKNARGASTTRITLRHKAHHIAVELPGNQEHQHSLILTPLLNETGECRLRAGGEELEFWQASRKILEKFLFADGEA